MSLQPRSRRPFVGRAPELARFRAALRADCWPWRALWVQGSDGMGTTQLCEEMASMAARQGCTTFWCSCQDLPPGWDDHASVLVTALGREPSGAAPAEALPGLVASTPGRWLLFLDGLSRDSGIASRVVEEVAAVLPAGGAIVVSTGSSPPLLAGIRVLGEHELDVIELAALRGSEVVRYLRLRGAPERFDRRVLELSGGHPLTMSLATAVLLRRGDGPLGAPDRAALFRSLLGVLLDEAPTATHRMAMEVCAVAHHTTQELLAVILGASSAAEASLWLGRQPWVESAWRGVCPHPVARTALLELLQQRCPRAYRELRSKVSQVTLSLGPRRRPANGEPGENGVAS